MWFFKICCLAYLGEVVSKVRSGVVFDLFTTTSLGFGSLEVSLLKNKKIINLQRRYENISLFAILLAGAGICGKMLL